MSSPFITLLSGGLTAISQIRSAKAEANQLRAQAKAENVNLRLRNEERDQKRRQLIASQRATAAGAGVVADTGSVSDIQAETAGQFARDASIDRMSTRTRTDIMRTAAKTTVQGGYLNAASTMFKAGSTAIGNYALAGGGSGGQQTAIGSTGRGTGSTQTTGTFNMGSIA